MKFDKKSLKNVSTVCAHYGEDQSKYYGAVNPPIFENSLFSFDSIETMREMCKMEEKSTYCYTRESNPTTEVAEQKIAALEGAERARIFSSGMAAITVAIISSVKSGDHVICVENVYPSAKFFITDYMARFGVSSTIVSGDHVQEIEDAIRDNTTLIYLESPTSITFQLQDIRAVTAVAKEHNIRTIIDNTWATPVFQNPLSMGVDLVVHSASKYLGGHSSIVAGVIAGSSDLVSRITKNESMLFGSILGPFESYLLIMGLRTLDLRMERHQKNALRVAEYLEKQKRVKKINYPGLASSPYHELAKRQMSGFSGLMSFDLDCRPEEVDRFVDAFEMFQIGFSWGGFESLIYTPNVIASPDKVNAGNLSETFSKTKIRTSIGLEHIDDILRDFDRAFAILG